MHTYQDPSAAIDDRVSDLVAQLTDAEKLELLTGQDMWSWRGIERLGIPSLKVTDGPHGVTCGSGDPAMSYPTAVTMASTWNTALMEELGVELGKEMHAKGYQVLLGPALDTQRAPKFGRNYESYSEDPVLSGKMAASWVHGVQSQGIGTTPKHLAAYATSGFMDDVQIDEQALREIYLKGFEIVIKESDPTGIMSSYNKVNGLPTSQHPMQQQILKDEWGFKGFCISDWRGALHIDCIESGMDLEMPGPGKVATPEAVLAEIDAGHLDWDRITDAVSRILRCHIRCGHLDAEAPQRIAAENTAQQQDLARRISEEGMVLLKNDNGLLPLSTEQHKKIALIGPNAAVARMSGGGSAAVSPFYTVSPLVGLRHYCGSACEIQFSEGCSFKGNLPLIEMEVLSDMSVSYYEANDCSGPILCTENVEQIDHAWGWVSPANGVPKNDWSALWQGHLTAPSDGSYEIALSYQDGGVRLWLDDELLIDDWEQNAGDFEEAYKDNSQSTSVTLQAGQARRIKIAYRKFANRSSLRLEWKKPSAIDAIEAACAVAKDADVAIVCVGLSNQFEGGGAKRADLELPGEQNKLIKSVMAANPNTVVVLIGGSPVIMEEWVDEVPALIQAWYPGVEGGNALARVLFGAVNPSGKLPCTLPKRYEDTPVFGHEDPVDGIVEYKEGVFVGYRHYDKYNIEPRFPFGFGLTYTNFALKNLRIEDGKVLGLLKNIGPRDGAEVVQVFAKQGESMERPLRALKAFAKYRVAAGAEQNISIDIPTDVNQYWDQESSAWAQQDIQLEICGSGYVLGLAYSHNAVV